MPEAEFVLEVIARFARNALTHQSPTDILYELGGGIDELLGGAGSGVSLSLGGEPLRFLSATTELTTRLEHLQHDTRQGPCQLAFETGELVEVQDLTAVNLWPAYRDEAINLGARAVVGIPIITAQSCIGVVNIYDTKPRNWTREDIETARLLTDLATSNLMRIEELRQAQHLADQLQEALTGRIFIEQAKGILAGERGISPDEAFEVLRRHARTHRASLRSVAHSVVTLGLRPD
jgi:GAF domain-containing protein